MDHPQNACAYVHDVNGFEVATVYGGGYDDASPCGDDGIWGPQPSRDVAGHLLASAPDLFKALEKIAYSAHADTASVLRGYAQDALAAAKTSGAP